MTPAEREQKMARLAELEAVNQLPENEQLAQLRQMKANQQAPAQAPLTPDQMLGQSGQSAYDQMSSTGKFGVGVAKGALQSYYGIKDLFTDLEPDEVESLTRLAGTQGGWATTGEVAGDLATFALPAAKLGELMVGLGKYAPKLLAKLTPAIAKRAAPVLADFGITLGTELLKAPTAEKSRTDRMTDSAIAYLATAGGMKFLKGLKGKIQNGFITPTDAAQELMDKGIKLTPNQMTEGKNGLVSAIENFMEFTPFTGAKVTDMKTRNLADWNKTLFNDPKVNPLTDSPIKNAGGEGFKELQNNFTKAYDDVWNSPELIPDNMNFGRLNIAFNKANDEADSLVGVNAAPQFKKILKDSTDSLNKYYETGDTKFLSDADDMLRDVKIDDFAATGEIRKIRDEIKSSMPNNLGNKLRDIDKNYANYAVLQRGGSYVDALKNNQELSPVNLMSAVKAKGKERKLTASEAMMQKEAQTGIDVFGNYRPKNSVLRKSLGATALYGAPLSALTTTAVARPLATDTMSEFIAKGLPETKQKALADILRTMGNATGVNSAKKLTPSLTEKELNDLLKRGSAYVGGADEY